MQNGVGIENMVSGARAVWNPGETITNYINLRIFLTLSLPQFSHVIKGFEIVPILRD